MMELDRELVADFLEEYREMFEGYLESEGIDPVETDAIIDAVRTGPKGGEAC